MKLLKIAISQGNYDLASHALVYSLVKVKVEQNGKKRRPQRQPERQEARLLQQGPSEAEKLRLEQALGVDGLDEEIAILRLKLRKIIESHPDPASFRGGQHHHPHGPHPLQHL